MIVLYDIYEFGELTYVGITTNPKMRMSSHVRQGKVGKGADMRIVAKFRSMTRAAAAEKKRIQELRPKLNIAYLAVKEQETAFAKRRREYERWQKWSAETFLKSRLKAERALREYYRNEKPNLPAWW